VKKHNIHPRRFQFHMGLEELTILTSKDRILLYLSDYQNMEGRYELPPDVIQQAIAFGTGIQRKHLSQYLKDLMTEDVISERKAHVQGMKQRMNGYYLTTCGHSRAVTLRNRISAVVVPVRMAGDMRKMRVSEINDLTSVHITLSDIVREAIQGEGLDMSRLETVEVRKRAALEEKEQGTEIYRRVLQTAWRDGRVTATERFLVEELRKHLEISDEQHHMLEAEIIKKLAQDHMEFRRIYRAALEVALADKVITGPEAQILEGLRQAMRISREEHDELVAEVEVSICGPPGCDEGLLEDALRLVKAQRGNS
jgi:tellurite resistance protein